jgi:hypothetical protein
LSWPAPDPHPAGERVLYKRPLPSSFLYSDRTCSSPTRISPHRSWRARMELPTLRSQPLLTTELCSPQSRHAAPPSPRAPSATACCAALTPRSHPTVGLHRRRRTGKDDDPAASAARAAPTPTHRRELLPPLTTVVGG